MASKASPVAAASPLAPAIGHRAFAAAIRLAEWRTMADADAIPQWDALAEFATEPNPFYESWYLLPSLRALDPDGEVKLLRFELGGELAALLPVVRERRYYGWPIPQLQNWIHPNCFLGAPLVARGTEVLFWRALLEWADRNAGMGLFLHFAQVPLDGPLHLALQRVLAEQGRTGALVHQEDRAMLSSRLSPEAYFEAAVPGKKRKELRRQYARLSELGAVTVERQHDGAGLSEWTDRFLALEAAGWKGTAGSALAGQGQTAELFREALRGAARRGRLERLALLLDGRPIAMLASFLTPPGCFSYKTTFDETYARFSPGVLLQRENLAVLDRSDVRWSDSCAAADHPMIERLWREKRAIGRLSIAIGGPLRRALFNRLLRAELGRKPAGI